MNDLTLDNRPWYAGITGYQWTVLIVACLGWVFDVFEGQIFVASMNEAMPSLLPAGSTKGDISYYNNWALGAFLTGGALGGVVFGILSDKIGRTKTMVYTILLYSLFTCVTAFARGPWEMIVLRFLVALGVGGEWAVASAMVAEVFPQRARAWSLGIFHASSVLGTLLATAAGLWIVGNPDLKLADYPTLNWRLGFAVGVIPALLTIWIRMRLKEPEQWVEAKERGRRDVTQTTGRLSEIFRGRLLRHTLVGCALAGIGLATFWGVHIYGKDLMRNHTIRQITAELPPDAPAAQRQQLIDANLKPIKQSEMLGMLLVTLGGGLGLISFGPICERLGRRKAFMLYHMGGFVMGVLAFTTFAAALPAVLYVMLPIFGFLTLGMHAGYAIYFPELYPTRLRGTGGGFCFNAGRVVVPPVLITMGWLQRSPADGGIGLTPYHAAAVLSGLYLLGVVVLLFAPETKGQELPE